MFHYRVIVKKNLWLVQLAVVCSPLVPNFMIIAFVNCLWMVIFKRSWVFFFSHLVYCIYSFKQLTSFAVPSAINSCQQRDCCESTSDTIVASLLAPTVPWMSMAVVVPSLIRTLWPRTFPIVTAIIVLFHALKPIAHTVPKAKQTWQSTWKFTPITFGTTVR